MRYATAGCPAIAAARWHNSTAPAPERVSTILRPGPFYGDPDRDRHQHRRAAIRVGSGPEHIAITPDGKTAYVANYDSGTVTPIATATNTAGPPIPVGSGPYAIAITSATVTHAPAFTSSPGTRGA